MLKQQQKIMVLEKSLGVVRIRSRELGLGHIRN